MNKLKSLTKFILSNFGPIVGFYFVNQFWGMKAGVIASIFLVVAEYFWLKFKNEKVSTFFYFSSGMIIVFGAIDLIIQKPFFIKFEASITNLFFAVFFGLSLFKDKSIIQEIAETQKKTSEIQSEDKRFFFKCMTAFWSIYFVVKSIFYLWINLNTSLSEGLIIRMIVGKVSLWIMLFISVGLSRQIWKLFEKLRLFPSQQNTSAQLETE